ncbi:MAG: hypothetical protein IT249_04975 [Chitinophagaceae bacterium]|nr:hypothetical protein [Chitinophagaceae bacterium]
MEGVKKLINSKYYGILLNKVKEVTKITINDSDPPFALLNYDMGRLKAAKVNAEVLERLLEEHMDSVLKFSVLKIGYRFDEEEDFPPGEELDDDDKPKTIEVLPYYKDFLVTALVEFYLLKDKPSELNPYLKATRIPHAKKYEKQLKDIYSKI